MNENQVLCIDAKYEGDVLIFWRQYGVQYPQQDRIYTIRDIVKHSTGDVGLLLEEIVNPKVPIKHPILGVSQMEPTFHMRRFTHLDGIELTLEEVREMIRQDSLAKLLNF